LNTVPRDKKDGGHVTVAQCKATHANVTRQISDLQTSVDQIVTTLLGEQKPGSLERAPGLVQKIDDIKVGMKRRWTPKEQVTILASLLTAIAAIVVAVFR